VQMDYSESPSSDPFPAITSNQLQVTNDDDGFAIQTLPFDFPFYGQPVNEVTVLTDGAITFDGSFAYIRDNVAVMNNRCIAAYCADLMIYPGQEDGIFYEGDETHATFRWRVSKYDMPGFDVDVAMTLYPDGEIQFFYGDGITPATDWSSGISLGDGNNYVITSIAGNINIPPDFAVQMASEPFPHGMSITSDGIFHGIPTEPGMTWDITFKVTDYTRISSLRVLPFSTVTTAVEDVDDNDLISVSPNPFSSEIEILCPGNSVQNATFRLSDVYGRPVCTIFDGKIPAGQKSFTWPVSASGVPLVPGIYFLHWNMAGKSGVKKLIFNN